MVFKSDKQRKGFFGSRGNPRAGISPKLTKSMSNEQRGKLLARNFIVKNPRASKETVIKFLKSKGVVLKGNPNGIARFIGGFKEKIKALNIPKKAGKVQTFLQQTGLEIGALQLEAEQKRSERFERRLKEVQLRREEVKLEQEEEQLRKTRPQQKETAPFGIN